MDDYNQHLSQEHAKVMKVAEELALEKDKMSNALASMWVRFEELITRYQQQIGVEKAS